MRVAAAQANERGRAAYEVMCLQTATQFGDPTGAARLIELSAHVQGPRVVAAAMHASALRDRDPGGLIDASKQYEQFGDRIAAADAAAQAAAACRQTGLRGAALTATSTARRLAQSCGADTPTLRANDTSIPLTPRQREILTLVANGLSNREISDRLVTSIRTVEGHVYRMCRRFGMNSRAELAALLDPH